MKDLLRRREWPIVIFSFFTLGAFAANDLGRGFVHTIGLSFIGVTVIWAAASMNRRRMRKSEIRVQGLTA
ncbi:MAG TPA: hypothetical protein VMD75_14030 [Candidatus Binataceae bacterium]|nr:hypothetical protein [Candidatus Binataceae bacterium]